MLIKLNCKGKIISKNVPRYDVELDNIITLLAYTCEFMDEVEDCDFFVGGFGEDNWNADVRTDLLTFLIQLPIAIISVENVKPFEIDFYEQGLERRLVFKPQKYSWNIECDGGLDWTPHPKNIKYGADALKNMLMRCLDNFLGYIQEIDEDKGWRNIIEDWKVGSWKP